MGPVRFNVDFVKNAFNEAQRTNNATFNDRANDAVFISYNGTAGEYIRITFGDATSRLALKDTRSIAGRSTVKSTDPIRIDHGALPRYTFGVDWACLKMEVQSSARTTFRLRMREKRPAAEEHSSLCRLAARWKLVDS
jgi:hypothetical protein